MDIVERLRACLRFDAPTLIESELEAAARDAIGEIARLRDENAKLKERIAWQDDAYRELSERTQEMRDGNTRLREDAERLDWLERETHKSSYAVQFRLLRDPAINAGMNRIECATTVGGGPWQRDVEGATLRAAIDAAMQKGE